MRRKDEALCVQPQRLPRARDIRADAVGGNEEGRNAGPAFDFPGNGSKVAAGDHRNRRSGKGNEARGKLLCRADGVFDQLFIVSQHSFQLGKPRDEDQRIHVVPARLVVGVIGRVAAGGVVHHRHAAELKKRRADAGDIGGIGRKKGLRLFHRQLSHPNPFC